MLLSLLVFLFKVFSLASALAADVLPGCQPACGNISVPYPFGLTDGCYAPGFKITCNYSYDPPKLFMGSGNIQIASLSFDNVIMKGWIARDCYGEANSSKEAWTDIRGTKYTFSYTRNKFTVLGCDTYALIAPNQSEYLGTGCVSFCRHASSLVNGSCSGLGCCQTAIPKGLKRIEMALETVGNHARTRAFNPCSYAFLIDQNQYEFKVTDFSDFWSRTSVPVVLDWAIGNKTCSAAQGSDDYYCGPNTVCSDSTNGPGYRCSCKKGYEGNPYLVQGCQDVNECEDPNNNPCVDVCTNTLGSYNCSCSRGSTGDGRKDGTGCTSSSSSTFPLVQVVLGCGLGFLFLLVTTTLFYWGLKRKRLNQLRVVFYKQNGGLLLENQISSREGAAESVKIFTLEELKKATQNYSHGQIVGQEGNRIVYKGILPDKRVVAIKKSNLIAACQIEQFINEVVILSQVIHRNVVKMIGCCLETEVPLLVYEYVHHGPLSYHLYGDGKFASLPWGARLRIAAEAAGALAYLHSATATPICHRNVKSSNILLDQNYSAKVSDFGSSRLGPMEEAHITTLVQRTLGYLDPEYFQTGLLTEKSDVYSFGVVLVELITGKPPLPPENSEEEERSLAVFFLSSMARNRLFDILEARVVNEADGAQVKEVAELAERCLSVTGEERPTMEEVAAELERAKRYQQRHPWAEENAQVEATGRLLDRSSSSSFASATDSDDQTEAISSIH